MKYAILHPAALLLPLALLTGCARTPDMTPVWQETLPGSGAKATLSNCTLQDEREVDYIYSREDQDWKTRPALFTTASPVLTLTGVTADQVELRFSEEIADLYLGYDRVMPQPKLDYILPRPPTAPCNTSWTPCTITSSLSLPRPALMIFW